MSTKDKPTADTQPETPAERDLEERQTFEDVAKRVMRRFHDVFRRLAASSTTTTWTRSIASGGAGPHRQNACLHRSSSHTRHTAAKALVAGVAMVLEACARCLT